MDVVGSVMTNKYSEGYPGQRYYGGNEFIDQAENLCRDRALQTFGLDPNEWGVNVQALSGSPANFNIYSALLEPHDRIMALDLPHGGHLSHGYQTVTKKVSMVSKYFEVLPYRLDERTGYIDMDELEKFAHRFRPKMIICGASAYARHIDFARFHQIADSVGAILHCDMAHISGLVAGGVHPSPFPHVDVVMTTTHKSLRGPRGAMIFFRKGEKGVDKKGNKLFHDLESGGTDNHLVLLNLKAKALSGAKVEKVCDLANITVNKNTVPGDVSALNPSGVRLGAPAMTSRGLEEKDFAKVADFIDSAVSIAHDIQSKGFKKKAEFEAAAVEDAAVKKLRADVEAFAEKFETIGQ